MRMWSCAGPKVLGPNTGGRQAWSRGDARNIGRHGLRGNAKGGSGGGVRPKVGSGCKAKGSKVERGFV